MMTFDSDDTEFPEREAILGYQQQAHSSTGKLRMFFPSAAEAASSETPYYRQSAREPTQVHAWQENSTAFFGYSSAASEEKHSLRSMYSTSSVAGAEDFISNIHCSSSQVVEDHTAVMMQNEHLFYKVVTPSDVGKLNRLVIPKQHAERCFPLDPCLRKKGRFLSFQDTSTGKLWWFRYSYWNSSQSYVFTKGWIRFVKENKLKAGDIVSFERGARSESFFISCRKRPRSSSSASSGGSITTSPLLHNHINASPGDDDFGIMNDEDGGNYLEEYDRMSSDETYQSNKSQATSSVSPMRLFGVDLRLNSA